jgi:hypothetical protein
MALSENHHERMSHLVERGRLAFESGCYLDAVAHWEQAWREEFGASRQLLQGLMQVAAAYRKQELAQPLGMVKLLIMGLERVAPIPDGFAGLRLDDFRAGLERSRRRAVIWVAGGPPPGPAASLARIG